MRVTLVAPFVQDDQVGLECSYARAFEALGHRVSRVPLSTLWSASRLPPPLREFEAWTRVRAAQRALQRKVAANDPELVVLIKGHGVTASTVRLWRSQGRTVVNVFPDNPFQAAALDLVSRELLAQFAALDRLFVHDRFAVGQLRQLGVQAEFIAFAWDPQVHDARGPRPEQTYPLVFLGHPDEERLRHLRAVSDMGLAIYGNWSHVRLDAADPLNKCIRGGMQRGRAMVVAMQSAQLSINILRTSQKTAHNMRTFETPACGVCCLSEASVGVAELMEPNREVALFRSPDELRSVAKELLRSRQTVNEIATAGHVRIATETYEQRAREVLAML